MKFKLDSALISEIIFHMENQDNYSTIKINDHSFPLPKWTPSDGFRLMQKFTNTLKNPILKQELSEALNINKGVFRAFKSVLEQHPQAEKQWHDYKDKKMKAEVIAWYNALREEWGLEPIGDEPEDNTSLVLEDFVIRQDNALSFTAETAEGEKAGCIMAETDEGMLQITKLEVQPEYRGMGLGKTLLAKFLEKAGDQSIMIDVPADSDFFSRSLLLEGFKPTSQKFIKK